MGPLRSRCRCFIGDWKSSHKIISPWTTVPGPPNKGIRLRRTERFFAEESPTWSTSMFRSASASVRVVATSNGFCGSSMQFSGWVWSGSPCSVTLGSRQTTARSEQDHPQSERREDKPPTLKRDVVVQFCLRPHPGKLLGWEVNLLGLRRRECRRGLF